MLEEREVAQEKKKLKRTDNLKACQENLQKLKQELESLDNLMATWSKVLNQIVSEGAHNGAQKDPSISWIAFFESAIGEKIEKPPVSLLDDGLDFGNVVEQISLHKALLRKDIKMLEGKVKQATAALEKKERTYAAKEKKAHEKAKELLEDIAAGKDKVKNEKQKILGLVNINTEHTKQLTKMKKTAQINRYVGP